MLLHARSCPGYLSRESGGPRESLWGYHRSMPALTAALFSHNDWANEALVDACSRLSDMQLDAEDFEGSYGSIRSTMLHIAGAQERYVQRLSGDQLSRLEESGAVSFDALRRSLAESGARLAELADGYDLDEDLQLGFMGQDFVAKRWLLFVQAINHATEHRTQVKSMLTAIGVTPPELDGWTFGNAKGGLIVK